MHENTPLLNQQDQQQAEALDFVAWQQQMEAGQVAVQASPNIHVNQPEVERPANIIEHFGDRVVTIYGVTDTLKNLVKDPRCPEKFRTPEADERFGAKILEKNNIAIPDAFAHLRSEKPNPKVNEAAANQRKDAPVKLETNKASSESAKQELVVTGDKLFGLEAESTADVKENASTEFSESSKTIDEAPVTAGGGPDLNELAKEMVDSLDAPRLPNVAILRKRLLDLDPITFKSTKVAASSMAEHSAPTLMAQDEALIFDETNYEEKMVELYLEAANEATNEATNEVANGSITAVPAETIKDETIADFLGITQTEQVLMSHDSYDLPTIDYAPIVNTLSNVSDQEFSKVLDDERPLVLQVLPTEIVAAYKKMIDELEPVAAEQLVEMVAVMSLIAERLQVLEVGNQSEGKEGQQIMHTLEDYYDQLLQVLKGPVTIDPEARRIFIAQIRANAFHRSIKQTFKQTFDIPLEGTREFDRDMIKQALMSQGRQQPPDRRSINLARVFALLGIGHGLQDA